MSDGTIGTVGAEVKYRPRTMRESVANVSEAVLPTMSVESSGERERCGGSRSMGSMKGSPCGEIGSMVWIGREHDGRKGRLHMPAWAI